MSTVAERAVHRARALNRTGPTALDLLPLAAGPRRRVREDARTGGSCTAVQRGDQVFTMTVIALVLLPSLPTASVPTARASKPIARCCSPRSARLPSSLTLSTRKRKSKITALSLLLLAVTIALLVHTHTATADASADLCSAPAAYTAATPADLCSTQHIASMVSVHNTQRGTGQGTGGRREARTRRRRRPADLPLLTRGDACVRCATVVGRGSLTRSIIVCWHGISCCCVSFLRCCCLCALASVLGCVCSRSTRLAVSLPVFRCLCLCGSCHCGRLRFSGSLRLLQVPRIQPGAAEQGAVGGSGRPRATIHRTTGAAQL